MDLTTAPVLKTKADEISIKKWDHQPKRPRMGCRYVETYEQVDLRPSIHAGFWPDGDTGRGTKRLLDEIPPSLRGDNGGLKA